MNRRRTDDGAPDRRATDRSDLPTLSHTSYLGEELYARQDDESLRGALEMYRGWLERRPGPREEGWVAQQVRAIEAVLASRSETIDEGDPT